MLPGLYVHIPFCRSKCPYCGFYSIPSSIPVAGWLDGLKQEILHYKDRFSRFDTLYLGGGTPTFLSTGVLKDVMGCLFDHFQFTSDAEMTIEANPGDINPGKANALKKLGFNRINLGVQSFNDSILKFLGRRHSAENAEKAIANLRSAGFLNIGLDLIYGMKAYGMKAWMNTLQRALAFQPEHLSCYQLTLEKGTIFDRRSHDGNRITLPEKTAAAHFLSTSAFLESKGFDHYEVSNFARGESFESHHNRKYWQHVPYLGLGPSAHSFDGKKRWWNIRSIKKYGATLQNGRLPIDGSEILTKEQLHLEALALGFRTRRGVDLESLTRIPSWEKVLLMLRKKGLLKMDHGRAVPTRRGYLLADSMPLCF
ncbi:MAG: coproporphyrinogen III oxidase [Desulfobacteraceae bacterium 4572_87]|nr:MAG: coproporphyrinogen III oxidase [Desulfobacteraceae bacterium 4572_87]